MKLKPVTHVIFDVDGLIIDSEPLFTIAFQKMLDEYNIEYTWELKSKLMGRSMLASAQYTIDELKLPLTAQEFVDRIELIYEELFPTVELLPGAEKLIRHLSNHNVPIAIASGSSQHHFDLKTKNHQNLFKLFHHQVLTGTDPEVKHGKPAPDAFLICAKRFPDNPDPSKVLVFEDAPNGVEAALSAGMQVVMVPDPRVDPALSAKATLVLQSLKDFKPEEFGLPPFNS